MTSVSNIELNETYEQDAPSATQRIQTAKLDADHREIVRWLNEELLPALDNVIRDDDTLVDGLVRSRNLHAEVVALIASKAGWQPKADVITASTGSNITLSAPGASIGGKAMSSGQRFLAKDQTLPAENGIYVWNGAAVAATRATDADTAAELGYAYVTVSVAGAATLAGTSWVCNQAAADITALGTTAITFGQVGGTMTSAAMSPVVSALTLALAASAFAFPATGGTTDRNLRDRFADVINVLDFGAIADNSTDCAPAINAALAAARLKGVSGGVNQTGGRVFLPKGRYLIKSTINLIEGDHLFGEPSGLASVPTAQAGSGTQIVVHTHLADGNVWNNSAALTVIGGGPVHVIDIAFNGTQTVTNSTWLKSGDGVTNIGLTQGHFKGLRLIGFTQAVMAYKFFDCDFNDCGFEYNEYHFNILGTGAYDAFSSVRFTNCNFFDPGTAHFVISSGAQPYNVAFAACEFYGATAGSKWGILLYDGTLKNWTFSACVMHHESGGAFLRPLDAAVSAVDGLMFTGCKFDGGSAIAIPSLPPNSNLRGISIVGCKFDDCLITADTETKGISIVGCRFVGASTVTITAGKNTVISGNDFSDCTGSVLVPGGVHDGLVIAGNLFPATYTSYGINVTSTRTKCSGNVYVADLAQP